MTIFEAKRGRGDTYCIKVFNNQTNEIEWIDDVDFNDFSNEDGYVMVQVLWNSCEVMNRAMFDNFVEEGY